MIQQGACPRCRGNFQGIQLCPRCGVQLQERRQVNSYSVRFDAPLPPTRNDGLVHRILVGLLCTQACYYGCRSLGSGILAWLGISADWWFTVPGVATLQALQATSVGVGAFLACGARRSGALIGLLLGLANSGLMLAIDLIFIRTVLSTSLLTAPMLLMLVGGCAGGLAARIWKPFPDPLVPTPPPPDIRPTSSSIHLLWGRLFIGSVVTALGAIFAADVFSWLLGVGDGVLHAASAGQSSFMIWEITVFAALVGGVIAGAESPSWLAQGFLSGFIALIGMFAFLSATGDMEEPAHAFLLNQLGVGNEEGIPVTELLLYAGGQTLLLCSIGGWLGGALFPTGTRYRPEDLL